MRSDRMLLAVAAVLAVGLALGFAGAQMASWYPAAFAAAVLVALLAGAGLWRPLAFVAVALLGLALALKSEDGRRGTLAAAEFAAGPFVAEGEIESVGRTSATLTVGGVRLRAVWPAVASPGPAVGERWRFAGWMEHRALADRSRRNLWVSGRGTFAERVRKRTRLRSVLLAVRAYASRRLASGLDHAPEAVALLRAILLGERERLDPGRRQVFVESGTMHIFAISGLHVGIVAAVVFYALVIVGFPVRWTGVVMAPVVWAYVAVIGAPPSAVRAAAMLTLTGLAPVFWRRGDYLVAWGVVFIAAHVVRPALLTDTGSLLSFTVMLAIVLYARVFRHGVTIAAWAAGVPIVAHCFGQFTWAGIVANLVLIPLSVVAVGAGVVSVAVGAVVPALSVYINNIAALTVRLMEAFSGAAAALPGASTEVEAWGFGECAAWYAVLLLSLWLIWHVRERRRQIV